MKINACVMAMGLLMGFGTVAVAQSPQGFLLSNYERQGAVSRVDAATSTVWIDGKPYKVNAQARLYVGVGAAAIVPRVEIVWPDGTRAVRHYVPVNQIVAISR